MTTCSSGLSGSIIANATCGSSTSFIIGRGIDINYCVVSEEKKIYLKKYTTCLTLFQNSFLKYAVGSSSSTGLYACATSCSCGWNTLCYGYSSTCAPNGYFSKILCSNANNGNANGASMTAEIVCSKAPPAIDSSFFMLIFGFFYGLIF